MKQLHWRYLFVVLVAVSLLGFVQPHAVAEAQEGPGPGPTSMPGDVEPPETSDPPNRPDELNLAPAAPPLIDVWYGSQQRFGHLGEPQQWVNILGKASDTSGIKSLVYSLNGGDDVTLSVGPDGRRLATWGDFNVEIAYGGLSDGTNTVVITATDNDDEESTETVTVDYDSGNVWPGSYSIDWSSVAKIEDVAQVVDGYWELDSDSLRTAVPGYDRLVAIGDMFWDDYEVTVPITIHSKTGSAAGVGLLMRWTGHTDDPISGWQPKTGWWPLGAIGWYRWMDSSGERLQIEGNQGRMVASDDSGRELEFNVPYNFKMRVTTQTGSRAFYGLKVWEVGTAEPVDWDLSGQEGPEDPQNGSFLLLAHRVDASFGDVTVTSLSQDGYVLTISKEGQGTLDPDVGRWHYNAGDVAILSATPAPGWVFDGWSGADGQEVVPAGGGKWQLTMDDHKQVTAVFKPAYTLTITKEGNGTVNPPVGDHEYGKGEVATLTVSPDPAWSFGGWEGPNGSELVPAGEDTWQLTMDGDKEVHAVFEEGQYNVAVAIEGMGRVEGLDNPYAYNAVATLVPIAKAGWGFVDWRGKHGDDLVDNGNGSWSLIVNEDKKVTAVFAPTRSFVPLVSSP